MNTSRRSGRIGASLRAMLPLLGVSWLASCGLVGEQATVGGETHFLLTCEGGCGEGLSCIAGVCTRGCEPGYSSCSELSAEASCVSSPADSAGAAAFAGSCDVLCGDDAGCASLGAQHTCQSGVCRAPADAVSELAPGAVRQTLVRAVEPSACQSGLRWTGGSTPSAEMRPGSDCMSCHGQDAARPFLLAGTLYPSVRESDLTQENCFGIEGVELTIIDAAGRELSTLTNRAGNFYLEGSASDFSMPYAAALRWSNDGQEIYTPMGTQPTYGGCARCHGAVEPVPNELWPELDPATVVPTEVLFLPGLYPSPPRQRRR